MRSLLIGTLCLLVALAGPLASRLPADEKPAEAGELTLAEQRWLFAGGVGVYAALVMACAVAALRSSRRADPNPNENPSGDADPDPAALADPPALLPTAAAPNAAERASCCSKLRPTTSR